MRPTGIVAAIVAAALVIAGCSASADPTSKPAADSTMSTDDSSWLGDYDLDGLDSRQVIDHLDALPLDQRPEDLMASIRVDELLLSNSDGQEAVLPMPGDEFYVSIAPYVNETHDCFYHSLTTCRGEFGNADMEFTVTRTDNGQVVVDGMIRTFDNGFTGLWLPRDIDATLSVRFDGREAVAPISTSGDDPTCVTTVQLA